MTEDKSRARYLAAHRPVYYTCAMPSKKSPTSIRLGDDREAKVKAFAMRRGLSSGRAILQLIDDGLEMDAVEVPLTPVDRQALAREALERAQVQAAHLAKPRRRWNALP